jgi:uncharacterized protein (TIGR02996 family)
MEGGMNEDAFLETIRTAPQDLLPRQMYADWLEENGDPRHEFVRTECRLIELIQRLTAHEPAVEPEVRKFNLRLNRLAKGIDPEWVARLEVLRPKLYRCKTCRKVLLTKDAVATNPRTYQKLKNTRYCKMCFEDAVRSSLYSGSRGYESSGSNRSVDDE